MNKNYNDYSDSFINLPTDLSSDKSFNYAKDKVSSTLQNISTSTTSTIKEIWKDYKALFQFGAQIYLSSKTPKKGIKNAVDLGIKHGKEALKVGSKLAKSVINHPRTKQIFKDAIGQILIKGGDYQIAKKLYDHYQNDTKFKMDNSSLIKNLDVGENLDVEVEGIEESIDLNVNFENEMENIAEEMGEILQNEYEELKSKGEETGFLKEAALFLGPIMGTVIAGYLLQTSTGVKVAEQVSKLPFVKQILKESPKRAEAFLNAVISFGVVEAMKLSVRGFTQTQLKDLQEVEKKVHQDMESLTKNESPETKKAVKKGFKLMNSIFAKVLTSTISSHIVKKETEQFIKTRLNQATDEFSESGDVGKTFKELLSVIPENFYKEKELEIKDEVLQDIKIEEEK